MEILTTEMIDQQWRSIENIDLDEVPLLIEMLGKDQPFILTYLMATGADVLNQKEREVLLFMGIMIWNITKDCAKIKKVEISTQELYLNEEKNISMLEYLAGEPESDFLKTVEKILTKYHQNSLLKYIIDRLMEDLNEDAAGIREENIGMIAIYLKTIIDCFDTIL